MSIYIFLARGFLSLLHSLLLYNIVVSDVLLKTYIRAGDLSSLVLFTFFCTSSMFIDTLFLFISLYNVVVRDTIAISIFFARSCSSLLRLYNIVVTDILLKTHIRAGDFSSPGLFTFIHFLLYIMDILDIK